MRSYIFLSGVLTLVGCGRWSRDPTFDFKGDPTQYQHVILAAEKWNQACGTNITVTLGTGIPIIEDNELPDGRLGITNVDGVDVEWIRYESVGYTIEIMTHEFGHALGLQHSTDNRDIMWPIANSSPVRQVDCDLLP